MLESSDPENVYMALNIMAGVKPKMFKKDESSG